MNDVGRFMFGVGALIESTSTGRILLLKRRAKHSGFNPDEWEFVYGRVQQFENVLDAVRREVEEEIGVVDLEIVRQLRLWHFFRGEPSAATEILGMTFWCRVPSEVVLLSSEHTAHQWVQPADAAPLIGVEGIRLDLALFLGRQSDSRLAFSDEADSISRLASR